MPVRPGEPAAFASYDDNGGTYDHAEEGRITVLRRGDVTRRFTHRGAKAWSVQDGNLVEVIHAVH